MLSALNGVRIKRLEIRESDLNKHLQYVVFVDFKHSIDLAEIDSSNNANICFAQLSVLLEVLHIQHPLSEFSKSHSLAKTFHKY